MEYSSDVNSGKTNVTISREGEKAVKKIKELPCLYEGFFAAVPEQLVCGESGNTKRYSGITGRQQDAVHFMCVTCDCW